jgi:plastocyanin
MKRGMIVIVLFSLALLMSRPASAAGIMVTQDGLSDRTLTVSAGEVISWIDLTGRALRIAFPEVQGAPVLKKFAGREVHVFFDRPGRYRYTLTLATQSGMREVEGEIKVR